MRKDYRDRPVQLLYSWQQYLRAGMIRSLRIELKEFRDEDYASVICERGLEVLCWQGKDSVKSIEWLWMERYFDYYISFESSRERESNGTTSVLKVEGGSMRRLQRCTSVRNQRYPWWFLATVLLPCVVKKGGGAHEWPAIRGSALNRGWQFYFRIFATPVEDFYDARHMELEIRCEK